MFFIIFLDRFLQPDRFYTYILSVLTVDRFGNDRLYSATVRLRVPVQISTQNLSLSLN